MKSQKEKEATPRVASVKGSASLMDVLVENRVCSGALGGGARG